MNNDLNNIVSNSLHYVRFKQQADYMATEVNNGSVSGIADILAIRKGRVHEYEIKVSMSDFKADFKKGGGLWDLHKHEIYLLSENERPTKHKEKLAKVHTDKPYRYDNTYRKRFVPDTFTFIVPAELELDATKWLMANGYDRYGLLIFDPPTNGRITWRTPTTHNNYFMRYAIRPKKLEPCYDMDIVRKRIAKRAGSEIANKAMDIQRLFCQLKDE